MRCRTTLCLALLWGLAATGVAVARTSPLRSRSGTSAGSERATARDLGPVVGIGFPFLVQSTEGDLIRPVNEASPAIVGKPRPGRRLRARLGVWIGQPTHFSYQWSLCNSRGASCREIEGATSRRYRVRRQAEDHALVVTVTATNARGMTAAKSSPTSVVPGPAPVNTAVPSVTGAATVGDVLRAGNGSWSNHPTKFSYTWSECSTTGSDCSAIATATSPRYAVTSSDEGYTLVATVTAANAHGSTAAESQPTSVVATPVTEPSPPVSEPSPPAPVNTAVPAVSGTAAVGDVLSASTGTWSNSPTSYGYQWSDCNSSGSSCTAISGATNSSYTVGSGDEGDTLIVEVTATNAGGSAEAESAATSVVATPVTDPPPSTPVVTPAPANTAVPSVSGTAAVGDVLSATTGTWSNSPTSYGYQWSDCNSSGSSCTAISGATNSSYTVGSSDEGDTLMVAVTATNAGGSAQAQSAVTGTVATPSSSSSSSGLDGIYVSGNELVNGDGQQIHLHGVDTDGTEYACSEGWGIFDTSNSAQNAADMASWHVNFVRMGLNALCIDCAEGVPTQYCGTNYMNAVEAWVDELNSYGIYVEVMLMWDFPGTSSAVGVSSMNSYQLAGGPTEDHAPQAWTTMAEDFKNNPDVMLGIWGEDYESWPCRLDGGVEQDGSACSSIQLSATTTPLAASVASGAVSSISVKGLADPLLAGETIWLGAGADSLTVTSNVAASSGTVTIPVSGSVSSSYASGANLTYPVGDIADNDGMTLSGSEVTEDYTAAGAQQAVNDMRGAGFSGPIVYSCATVANVCANPDGGGDWGAGTWLTEHPTDPDNSLVAAADLYGPTESYGPQTCSGTACFNTTIEPIIKAGYPFIINEAGESSDGSECDSSYMQTMLPWMDANGASGYAAWSWFDGSSSSNCLDLVSSYTSATPNTDGTYASWLHSYYTTTFPANQ